MNPETTLMHRIMHAASRGACRLFRQNVGMAWAGKSHRIAGKQRIFTQGGWVGVDDGDVIVKHAAPFHAGVEGMSDLGGWKTVVVTQEMLGRRIAVYIAAEVKTPTGRVEPAQRDFIDAVLTAGGIAGVVRSPEDAAKLLDG